QHGRAQGGLLHLVGAEVHGAATDAGETAAALIGGDAVDQGVIAEVDRQAAGLQGERLGRAPVVGQRAEVGVGDERVGQPARAADVLLDQVAAAPEGAGEVGDVPARGAVGHDAVVQRQRATVVDAPAGAAGGDGREGAVADRQRAAVADPAAALGGVAREGAVTGRQHTTVADPAAFAAGGVAREGAVTDRQRATVVDAAAEVGGAIGNG